MNIRDCLLFFLFAGLGIGLTAQTAVQREKIIQDYELEVLQSLSVFYANAFQFEKLQAEEYAERMNIPTEINYPNGQKSVLRRIDEDGNLIYVRTYNNTEAARTIGVDRLYPMGGLGLKLEGENMTGAVWDAGKVRGTHELLSGKIDFKDDAAEYDDHATHVSGTMVGKKLQSSPGNRARGMAYKAKLDTYDWDDDISEMYAAAESGLLVSNHSYGADLEQITNPQNFLGRYDAISASIDRLTFQAPFYSIVIASGNDRNASYTDKLSEDGYHLLAGEMNTAKNGILVTAVDPVDRYAGAGSVHISEFSSWGPTIDNRVKPDLAADGLEVFSSVATDARGNLSDKDYAYYSGTSSAAPGVAGSILLLQELNSNLGEGEFLRSATIKALLIATAKETGDNAGPDPIYGWGLTDVEGAAQLLLDNALEEEAVLEELTLVNGETYTQTIEATDETVIATIVWTDPAGKSHRRGDDSSVLVNDLDIRIRDSKGEVFYPWRLNKDDYTSPALKDGDNEVDNVEKVTITGVFPEALYSLEVSHKGELENQKQDFSLVVSGAKIAGKADMSESDVTLYPNPASDWVNLELDAGEEVTVEIYDMLGKRVLAENFANSYHRLTMDVSSLSSGLYFVSVYTKGRKITKKMLKK